MKIYFFLSFFNTSIKNVCITIMLIAKKSNSAGCENPADTVVIIPYLMPQLLNILVGIFIISKTPYMFNIIFKNL